MESNETKLVVIEKPETSGNVFLDFLNGKFSHLGFRYSLALCSSLVLVIFLAKVTYMYYFLSWPHFAVNNRPYNDFTQAALEIKIEQSNMMFQFVILLTTAIWGLLIAKKGEAVLVLRDYPELIMSFTATVLLFGSLWCYFVYMNRITDIYLISGIVSHDSPDLKTGIADIFDPKINYLFDAQFQFLIAGFLNAILTFISAHKLK